MGDREDEELQMALQMSMQGLPPEAKRSKLPPPQESAEESPEMRNRRMQRELMAAAAEKRIRAMAAARVAPAGIEKSKSTVSPALMGVMESFVDKSAYRKGPGISNLDEEPGSLQQSGKLEAAGGITAFDFGEELSQADAEELFLMMFGSGVSKSVLEQWSNQGIRFSTDPETSMGLVQHEGGPCGVLATIQAYVLKYLLFLPEVLDNVQRGTSFSGLGQKKFNTRSYTSNDNFASITEDRKGRALVCSMVEILFLCGSGKSAVVATVGLQNYNADVEPNADKNEIITKGLGNVSIEAASDLQNIIKIKRYTSPTTASHHIEEALPVFKSRMGAMLFLISALLSRGLETIQADRDDPSLPLVTAPFGHASQEIVNLLICGQAVPNVFDGRMDLGGGMFLKGIPAAVEVGFLTLLEALNLCKVGDHLKCPKWPIWVVGSESHYTVLFALDSSVQEENELEERESRIRRAFDSQDQSGGGGFISVEGFQQVLRETSINLPCQKFENLTCTGFVVWSEFWQALLDLDKSLGGFKDSSGLMCKKQFDLYHFNGIAKSVSNSSAAVEGEIPVQRPRLCKLNVLVPPRWTQEEFLADVMSSSSSSGKDNEINQPPQHAPLVDCIRTRWPRATCSWVGDAPSIV